ncbi:RHS repeat-associated core domain-containing protein, partial [Ralstonia solanacearum]
TPRVITDTNNLMVWRWDQADPFGATLPDENPTGLGVFTYNLRFPGQVYDAETGKHYNANRDYDPAGGRYIQSDPIGLHGGQPSTYGYVGENPVSSVDPLGRSAKDVARIISSFHIITGQMTGDGLRNPNGTYNNTCRALPWLPGCPNPNRFKDCGEQTEYMNSKLDQQTYDAHWFFGLDSGFGHAWGFAYSSDPNDPVITYDTRASSISVDQNCPNCHGWFGDRMWGGR